MLSLVCLAAGRAGRTAITGIPVLSIPVQFTMKQVLYTVYVSYTFTSSADRLSSNCNDIRSSKHSLPSEMCPSGGWYYYPTQDKKGQFMCLDGFFRRE